MEQITTLLHQSENKPVRSGRLETTPTGSATTKTPRQMALSALIQNCRLARGMDLLNSIPENLGFPTELDLQVNALHGVLQEIPLSDLADCGEIAVRLYARPTEGWREPFGATHFLQAWQMIVDDRRQTTAKVASKQLREQTITYACYYCLDQGWQHVLHRDGGTSARPCICQKAPAAYRKTEPLSERTGWTRNHFNQWVRE